MWHPVNRLFGPQNVKIHRLRTTVCLKPAWSTLSVLAPKKILHTVPLKELKES